VDKPDVFAVDPRGYVVICSERQMEEIYEHHPELRSFWATVNDMKIAIEKAQMIYKSTKGEKFNIYYLGKNGKNTELKVVVKFDDNNEGILWAAQPSSVGQRKPGEMLVWPQMKS
jgi:hypothetical protein